MEFLKELLGEELFNQISTAVLAYNENPENKDKKVEIGNIAGGQYVDKGKFESTELERKNLEAQVNTLNTTIGELKKGNKGNGDLQDTITKLQTELGKMQEENQKVSKTYAIKEKLAQSGVVDPDYLIFKAGGIDGFTFDGNNNPVGIDDVLKPYREDAAMAHLFKPEENKPKYNPAGGGTGAGAGNPFAKDTFNMTKQGELLKSNPEQARFMAAAAGVTL